MIEFKDVDGDAVKARPDDVDLRYYCIEVENAFAFAVLDRDMARALAADLLAFADPEGAPTWDDLANLLVEIDAAETASENCEECERIRDVAEDSGYYCIEHSARVREARSTQGRYVALLSRIPKVEP